MSGVTPSLRLVLVHGTQVSAAQWHGYAARLGPAIEVITPDLPAHGTRRDEEFTWEGALAVIDEAVRSAPAGRPVVLGGHSLGGYLAMAWTARHPEALAGLVPMGSCAIPRGPGAAAYRLWGRLAQRIGPERMTTVMDRQFERFVPDDRLDVRPQPSAPGPEAHLAGSEVSHPFADELLPRVRFVMKVLQPRGVVGFEHRLFGLRPHDPVQLHPQVEIRTYADLALNVPAEIAAVHRFPSLRSRDQTTGDQLRDLPGCQHPFEVADLARPHHLAHRLERTQPDDSLGLVKCFQSISVEMDHLVGVDMEEPMRTLETGDGMHRQVGIGDLPCVEAAGPLRMPVGLPGHDVGDPRVGSQEFLDLAVGGVQEDQDMVDPGSEVASEIGRHIGRGILDRTDGEDHIDPRQRERCGDSA